MRLHLQIARNCMAFGALCAVLSGCAFELGEDPFAPADAAIAEPDAPPLVGVDAGPPVDAFSHPDAPVSVTRAPLDPDFFYCRIQPDVLALSHCASGNGCHAEATSLRLDLAGERDLRPTCVADHPTSPVPALYYMNLARSRAAVRATASRSDLYTRPQGRNHPVTLFTASDPRAALLVRWIEGDR